MAPVAFINSAFAQLQLPPAAAPVDLQQVSQNLTQLCGNLGTWTLRVATALNLLIPNGGPLPVSQGGTGLTSGTSGGIPYFSSTTTMASSALLAANAIVRGGGAGAAPATDADWTIAGHVLIGNINAAAIPATISGVSGTQVIINQANATNCVISPVSYAGVNNLMGWRSEGTGGTPTATGAGNTILQMGARGFDGTNWTSFLASVSLSTINQTSSTDHSSQVTISTVPTSSTTIGTAATFTSQGCSFLGTNTNDSASAGQIGEYASTITLLASEVSVNNAAANVATLSLTAGDWDVWGEIWFDTSTGAATISGPWTGAITTTSATLPTVPADNTSRSTSQYVPTGAAARMPLAIATCRISLATTQNVFLVGLATTSAGTANAYGKIAARRVR